MPNPKISGSKTALCVTKQKLKRKSASEDGRNGQTSPVQQRVPRSRGKGAARLPDARGGGKGSVCNRRSRPGPGPPPSHFSPWKLLSLVQHPRVHHHSKSPPRVSGAGRGQHRACFVQASLHGPKNLLGKDATVTATSSSKAKPGRPPQQAWSSALQDSRAGLLVTHPVKSHTDAGPRPAAPPEPRTPLPGSTDGAKRNPGRPLKPWVPGGFPPITSTGPRHLEERQTVRSRTQRGKSTRHLRSRAVHLTGDPGRNSDVCPGVHSAWGWGDVRCQLQNPKQPSAVTGPGGGVALGGVRGPTEPKPGPRWFPAALSSFSNDY